MPTIDLIPVASVPTDQMAALLNDPRIARHMPLASPMSEDEVEEWAQAKDAQWTENGYGPWAFLIDDQFAGWGGFQREDGEADLGLVLRPEFWGIGRLVFDECLRVGFEELGLESIIVLLPPTRRRFRALTAIGFEADGEVIVHGSLFRRFRLARP